MEMFCWDDDSIFCFDVASAVVFCSVVIEIIRWEYCFVGSLRFLGDSDVDCGDVLCWFEERFC